VKHGLGKHGKSCQLSILRVQRKLRRGERNFARRAKPRFFADETSHPAVALFAKWAAGFKTFSEAGLTGHPDENHAAYALRTGLILLTCDRDFLDNRRFPLPFIVRRFRLDFGGEPCGDQTGLSLFGPCLSYAPILRQVVVRSMRGEIHGPKRRVSERRQLLALAIGFGAEKSKSGLRIRLSHFRTGSQSKLNGIE